MKIKFIIFLATLLFPVISIAENNLYTVENVEIFSEDKNASVARQKALDDGKIKAFYSLLKQLNSTIENENTINNFKNDIINSVSDFEVKNEMVTPNTYQAILKISFNKDFIIPLINKLYINKSIKFIEIKEKPEQKSEQRILVLPLVLRDDKVELWNNNLWFNCWEQTLNQSFFYNKIILPTREIDDINITRNIDFVNDDYFKLIKLSKKYQSDSIIIALIENVGNYYELKYKILSSSNPTPPYINYHSKITNDKEIFIIAIQEIINQLLGLNKKEIIVNVPIERIEDWLMIKDKLAKINLIESTIISEISNQIYKIEIKYRASNIDSLIKELKKDGLTMLVDNSAQYIIKLSE